MTTHTFTLVITGQAEGSPAQAIRSAEEIGERLLTDGSSIDQYSVLAIDGDLLWKEHGGYDNWL